MTRLRALSPSLAWLLLALAAGCQDEAAEPRGEGGAANTGGGAAGTAQGGNGTGPSTTSGAGPSTTSGAGGATAAASSTSVGASSSSSSGGAPCDSLADLEDPTPTAGRCEGGAAITCGMDGTLVTEECVGDTECRTYELNEWVYDGQAGAWREGRVVEWAGCVPVGAEACSMSWTGHFYEADELPTCDGADRRRCWWLPAPTPEAGFPQVQYGSEEGWMRVEPCEARTICAGYAVGELICIPEDTPLCDGAEPRCVGDTVQRCFGQWESLPGYQEVSPCDAGDTCYEGTEGPFCRREGESPCDPASYQTACSDDAAAIVSCVDGWTLHDDCATCLRDGDEVPCACDEVDLMVGFSWDGSDLTCTEVTSVECVPRDVEACDPDLDVDTCDGDVARRCIGHWEEIDCADAGLVCDVAEGRAGCRAASAAACDPVSSFPRCEGDRVVACCTCDRTWNTFLVPPLERPCVTGFEVELDCSELGAWTCEVDPDPLPSAACVARL